MAAPLTDPLVGFLTEKRGALSPLLILMHDHPDPDAIASAWSLAHLVDRLQGIKTRIVHGGIIGRMENQTLVRVLRIPLRPVRPQEFERYRNVAIVDTQPPFQNNRFPARRRATLVVDHHRRHAKTDAELMIIDETAGATTTLLYEALTAAGIEIPSRLATAMVYGIGSETQHLGREAGPRDVAAYRALFGKCNMRTLSKIQNPPRPSSFFYTLGKAIHRAFIVNRVIGVHLGPVPSQDIVAHMADFLLTHEKAYWSIVTGRYEGRLYISLRTRNARAEAGRLLWRLLGAGTSAGGHAMIAGGSILVGAEADELAWHQAEEDLTSAFLRSQGYDEPWAFQYPYEELRDHEREA
jgi:nanoRNase/pAp phosphatase (c-di-AMP/oligoRNAs hydrolase)